MSKFFKNIKSYKDLKEQYKNLIKVNHPDNGGQLEIMQEINCEYDALFKIWKDRAEKEQTITEEEKTETAKSTRRHFYSAYGWEGSRYDSNLTLKEIAKIVRNYVKEKYPTCKFSIRTHYASMCQELSVDLLEFPVRFIRTAEELKEIYHETFTYTDREGVEHSYESISDELQRLFRIYRNNYIFTKDSWKDEEFLKCYEETINDNRYGVFYASVTEYFQSVIDDVNAFIASYNYDDSDSMTDYFDVNFYGGKVSYSNCKVVPKTARIQKAETAPATTKEEKTESEEVQQIETTGKHYTVEESKHTKTGEIIYLVKWLDTLSKDDYIKLNTQIKKIGGYYSKFTHSFIFKSNPENDLLNIAI